MKKVAWIVTHPIQYYSPMYREIAKSGEIDLTVYYFSNFSVKGYIDKEFGKEVKWDIPLLDGYNYKFLKNFSWSKSHGKFFSYFHFGLIHELKRNKYDLVVIHGWNTLSHLLAIFTCIVTKTPYALRGDTNAFDIDSNFSFKKRVRNKFLTLLFDKADALFYVGEQNKQFYSDFLSNKKKLIKMPFAVDNEYFRSYQLDIAAEKASLNISKNQKVILFTGKLIHKKNPDLLIKAVEGLNDYVLLIVGEGELRSKLEETVKKLNINCHFLGFVNQSDMPKYYWIADIFVIPSSKEPWGLAINEAMNCECAIIASNRVGAADDLVKDNGFIFSYQDDKALEIAIKKFTNDKELLSTCKARSKKIVNNYSFQDDAKALTEYFKQYEAME